MSNNINLLHLTGYGVKVKVNNLKYSSELEVTGGRDSYRNQSTTQTFRPRKIPYDTIIIDGHSGYLSLQALHWLSKNNVPVFILNYDGTLISSILPSMPIKADIRAAQMQAAIDQVKTKEIASLLIEAKIQNSLIVLD